MKPVPKNFKPFLWSYDFNKLDLRQDKKRIITNILNFGTVKPVNLLFKIYNKKDIKETVVNPLSGEWNKKSLNFWSLILGVKPSKNIRRIIMT